MCYSHLRIVILYCLLLAAPPLQASSCCSWFSSTTPEQGIEQFLVQEKAAINKKVVAFVTANKEQYFLVRGSNPVAADTFCYEELSNDIEAVLHKQGYVSFDKNNYYLVCYSLLNFFNDFKALRIEKNFFNDPNKGQLKHHPLYGALFDPCKLSEEARIKVLKDADFAPFDKLDQLVDSIRNSLQQNKISKKQTVVYVHCRAGKDRTGEAIASFLMKHRGKSYQEVMDYSIEIAGRKLAAPSEKAIKWYAFYLRDVKGLTTIGPIEGK